MFFGKKKKAESKQVTIQEQLGLLQKAIKQQEDRLDYLEKASEKCAEEAKAAQRKGQKASFLSQFNVLLLSPTSRGSE